MGPMQESIQGPKQLQKAMAIIVLACSMQACAAGSIAELNIYDRTEGKQLQVYWHEGRAYVAGKPGNEYRVSLRSRERDDILAVVSVDGVNAVTGQSADASQSGYVLSPGSSMSVQGWRKSLSETAAFYFTMLADSYAARTGRPDNVGVIGVALFRRKQEPQPMGQIAPSPRSRNESSSDAASAPRAAEAAKQIGTGHGRHETSYARYVAFQHASLVPAETITIYYDSRANLVARGVIREPVPVAPLPRPFPGFVPDPA
jgi:hypothetical protein